MPPLSDCSLDFLKDVLAGRKRLIPLGSVKHVEVPRYKEFSTKNLLGPALQEKDLQMFLPDVSPDEPVNKQWLFDVIATVKPGWWQTRIAEAMQARLERASVSSKPQTIEIQPEFLSLIQNSRHVPHSSRGKVVGRLIVKPQP